MAEDSPGGVDVLEERGGAPVVGLPDLASGPDSARSPQATIGAFPEALVPEDELPQPAMAMAAAAATASAAGTRLLIDLLLMVAASHS